MVGGSIKLRNFDVDYVLLLRKNVILSLLLDHGLTSVRQHMPECPSCCVKITADEGTDIVVYRCADVSCQSRDQGCRERVP